MDNDELNEYLRDLFDNGGYASGTARQTIENAYETLLGYDVDTMNNADERIGYWEDRLASDLSLDDFVPTFLNQAESDLGTHMESMDLVSNILAVSAAREWAQNQAATEGDPPTDASAAATALADLAGSAGDARADALGLAPGDPDFPDLPDGVDVDTDADDQDEPEPDDPESLTLAAAMDRAADDDLPDEYELSDGALALGTVTVASAEASLATAQAVIDDAVNTVALAAEYGIDDDWAGVAPRSGSEPVFQDADSVRIEGPATTLNNQAFALQTDDSADAKLAVGEADGGLIISLLGFSGFGQVSLAGSENIDAETPILSDMYRLPDDAGLLAVADADTHVQLGDGGQTYVGSGGNDVVLAGAGDDDILFRPDADPEGQSATVAALTQQLGFDPIIDPDLIPDLDPSQFFSFTTSVDLGEGGSNMLGFGDVIGNQFVIEGFETGFGSSADSLDFSAIAAGTGVNNTADGDSTELSLNVVDTSDPTAPEATLASDATVIAFEQGEAASAAEIADEFAVTSPTESDFAWIHPGIGTGPFPQPRNANLQEDSQLLFLIADGNDNTNIWYWDDEAGDGSVAADELDLLGTLVDMDDPGSMTGNNLGEGLGNILEDMHDFDRSDLFPDGPILSATSDDGGL